jgi:hypothetical protein
MLNRLHLVSEISEMFGSIDVFFFFSFCSVNICCVGHRISKWTVPVIRVVVLFFTRHARCTPGERKPLGRQHTRVSRLVRSPRQRRVNDILQPRTKGFMTWVGSGDRA